jgi:hypothetical protein
VTTPTCIHCGNKFPGDPCRKCGLPAGLSKADGLRMRAAIRAQAKGDVTKSAIRAERHPATKRKRAHGRPR